MVYATVPCLSVEFTSRRSVEALEWIELRVPTPPGKS